ncbi:MAG: hypothetical protein EXQ59_04865 [Acidobacteria bacterium]|nr:hypothetical protein [Acidobacteriota bacterium]
MKSAVAQGVVAWLTVLMVAWALIAFAAYGSRDPDSTVYSEISGRLSMLPLSGWIAPDWSGSWGLSGPFREHPIGIFVLPALLGLAGYPAEQAAYAIGALFSVLALLMVRKVASPLVRDHEAIAAQWAALILPIAFTYRVRANQEYPVLVLTLFALYATDRTRRTPAWMLGIVSAACALALVKGIFVIFLPVVCALWLLFIRATEEIGAESPPKGSRSRGDSFAWTGIGLAVVAVIMLAFVYDWAYQRSTGDSFLSFYLNDRIAANAGLAQEQSFRMSTKLYNVVWYLARVLWFAIPGSLVLLLSAGRLRNATPAERRAVSFALLAAAAYVAAMSLGANKADRFIFPAYFIVGTAGALVAMRRWNGVDRLARRLAALPADGLPLAWLSLFILTLATERRLPYVKFWTS